MNFLSFNLFRLIIQDLLPLFHIIAIGPIKLPTNAGSWAQQKVNTALQGSQISSFEN